MVEDWIWDGSEDCPGFGFTLALLHYLVPAAEEADLLDELDSERRQTRGNAMISGLAWVDEVDFDLAAEGEPEQHDTAADAPLSIGQILGMLEHLLGAEIVEQDFDPLDDDE